MRNPFRRKPPKDDVVVLYDLPCPKCSLADYRNMHEHKAGEVVECVNCHTQWLLARLLSGGYTSGKGQG